MAPDSLVFPDPTPSRLLHAAEAGDVQTVLELLKAGADANETSDDGWTPLIVAAKEGNLATLDALLSASARPDPQDDTSHSALRGAAMHGHVDACRRLLAAGATVNQTSGGRRTPLMGAAMHGHAEIVALLCAHGADPSLRNDSNEDAAALGKLHGHDGCLTELKRAGLLPTVIASAAPPSARVRVSSNQPEARRNSILDRLAKDGARQLLVPCRGSAALDEAMRLGVLTPGKRRIIDSAHAEWTAGGCNPDLLFNEPAGVVNTDTGGGKPFSKGVVPFFFAHSRPDDSAPLARRLAWHGLDSITPLYAETNLDLQADASLVLRTCELLLAGCPLAYTLTTHPGHHASADCYGGYCFVNWACMLVAALKEAGKRPFLVDVDYHAGDGSADILEGGEQISAPAAAQAGGAPTSTLAPSLSRTFVSLHAVDDYPFVPKIDAARWAVPVPAGAKWPVYAEQLQGALGRIPEGCDVLVLSLGYDTLGLDPEAFGRSALGLTPPDFGEMAKMMCETKLAVAVIQEGGYKMGEIPEAAAQFWAAASTAATRAA